MKRQLLTCLCLVWGLSTLHAQVQYTTERPRIDDINDSDVTIKRVELTDQYTIIYMKFQAPEERALGRSLPFSIPMPRGGLSSSNIGFQPTSRLYVNQGERSFKFIKAENIPAETRRAVQPGERVDFVAYFERIAPGYTTFDLYECRDSRDYRCFNFWGVHIINPLRKQPLAQQRPKPPVLPKQVPPRYTPRTSPGLGAPATPPVQPNAEPTTSGVAINGTTRDAKTKEPVVATVSYRLISGAGAATTPTDSVQSVIPSGNYKLAVGQRGIYAVTASAKGYFSLSDTLATNRVDVTRDFDLVPIEAGTKITLKNIYFNESKFNLKPESFPELDQLATVMQANPSMQIRLEGHTDTIGDFDANVKLSRERVNEVKKYLVGKGVSGSRIETVGYGPSRPINTNKSLKERPENRRVEMVIVKA